MVQEASRVLLWLSGLVAAARWHTSAPCGPPPWVSGTGTGTEQVNGGARPGPDPESDLGNAVFEDSRKLKVQMVRVALAPLWAAVKTEP